MRKVCAAVEQWIVQLLFVTVVCAAEVLLCKQLQFPEHTEVIMRIFIGVVMHRLMCLTHLVSRARLSAGFGI